MNHPPTLPDDPELDAVMNDGGAMLDLSLIHI